MHFGRRNEEPLTLPDCVPAFDLGGAKTRNRCPYIVNAVTGHRSGEPVTLITAEQELILVIAIPNHQHKMARSRPHIRNLGNSPVPTANPDKLAITIPARINSDFFSLPHTWFLDFQARAHAGEMPTQILSGRHKLLCLLG
jgi:hypothetical protein